MSLHVTFRQLQVFESVARHRSYTRAAEELHLTQPAVSMQVKQLEHVLGLALFEHLGRRVYLTDAGEIVLHHSRRIATELNDAGQALEDLRGIDGGRLRLAVVTTVNYFATRLLAGFCRDHPGVRVTLDVTNRESVIRLLEENATDVVLMGRPPDTLNLVATPFMDNPLVLIAPPDHPLAGRRRVRLDALREEAFLTREPGSGTRAAMERFFEDKGLAPRTRIEMSSNEAIKQSVEAGLGLGMVSAHTVELELAAGRLALLDVESFPILKRWFVVHREGKRLSPSAQAFIDHVMDAAPRGPGAPHGRGRDGSEARRPLHGRDGSR